LLTYLAVTHPDDHELMMLSAILASGALLTAFDAADCWLQAINQSRATSLIRLGGFLGGALLKCVAILAGASVLFIAIATVVESAIIAGAYWWRLSRNQLTPSFAAWDRQELRTLFVDGKLMILSAMTVVVYSKLDILAIGSLMSKQELGTYAIAASMYGAWNVLGVSLAQAWAPHIAAAQRVGRRGYLAALRFFLGVMMAVSVLGSAVLAFIAPWVFSLLFGPAYREGADVFSWLIWASVPVFLGVASSQIIINERLYWISLVRTALGMAVGLAFIVPAASYGVLGVAVLVIVSSSVATSAILISPSARSTLKSAFFSYRDSA
jgi:O-antigen/teichoic acid export membrane protein